MVKELNKTHIALWVEGKQDHSETSQEVAGEECHSD